LIFLGIATVGVGGYFVYVNVPEVATRVDEAFGIDHRAKGAARRAGVSGPKGVFPSGYYLSKSLSGVGGAGSGAGKTNWDAPGDGENVWVVVAASVPAAIFVMPEDRYARMKEEYVARFGLDGAKLFPGIEECRFFDPGGVFLAWPDGEEVEGLLVNLDFGVFKGFYQAFESHPQPGTPDSDWVATDEQMEVEIAFLVEEDRFDPAGLRIRFGAREAVAVPATRLK
jgi:hypothetical protein